MGQALPKPALRPFLPADTPVLAAIFVAAIQELTGDDYGEAQQEAWASAADDEEQFGKKLAGELTLIATLQNSPVGFASLKGADHIEMLYVHPSAVGQGVCAMLCTRLTATCTSWSKSCTPRLARLKPIPASAEMSPGWTNRGSSSMEKSRVAAGASRKCTNRLSITSSI